MGRGLSETPTPFAPSTNFLAMRHCRVHAKKCAVPLQNSQTIR